MNEIGLRRIKEHARCGNKEYAVLAVLLDSHLGHRLAPFVLADGFDGDAALDVPWSSGERVIVETAVALFRSDGRIDITDAVNLSSGEWWDLWVAMIAARRNGLRDRPAP